MSTRAETHSRYMSAALSLARRQLGCTWPNPAVGAVLVKDGQIIATGMTASGGRPHAETEAIRQAGKNARGATLYVSLEPCSHHGKTAPCTDAIVKAGITRCVVACRDPNHAVNGQGIAQLKKAGIEVVENICRAEAEELNRGFFSVMRSNRPSVSLKIATSLDGKITTGTKERWITSEPARNYGHLLRSRYDAILTGIGTVLADDPELTCRLPGLEDRSPVRVVIDSRLRTPKNSALVRTAKKAPLWIMTSSNKAPDKNITLLPCPADDDGIRLDTALTILAKEGITRVLVEAGRQLTTSFIKSGLVDRIYWFRAPVTIGSRGMDAVNGGLASVIPQWRSVESIPLSPDTLEIFEPCSPAS